jgi:hypothetical protein
MEITKELVKEAQKAWQVYSENDKSKIPWRNGLVSKTAFVDGYLFALEYLPVQVDNYNLFCQADSVIHIEPL